MTDIGLVLTSTEETTEVVEEVLEEVLQYTTDDIYQVLLEISDKLGMMNDKIDGLQETGNGILQLLQNSFLDSVVAFLFILVCFEIMRLVRGWTKGEKFIGRNS